ncbi:OmpA family protein [Massilia sp. BJB1822]|uniref:OmpA family protein n=1 Tax=Massilia sp. BJB1822 TaxID=2744470 RepID=UPI001593D418|nr:OmpA family protein [Massilia sp. BJB1822]NVD97696.1 OmpA family protein [Massilia sp. BJB1822]
MHRLAHTLNMLAAAASLLAVVACTSNASQRVLRNAALPAKADDDAHMRMTLTQLGHGSTAYYARCGAPACPVVTPKTLAGGEEAVALRDERDGLSGQAARTGAAEAEMAVIHFAHGSARLDSHARSTLMQFLPIAGQSRRIEIAGRTDSSGGEAINHALAMARAQAVRRYLERHLAGREASIQAHARGRCCYVADNGSEAGRSDNRRAEIVFRPALEEKP